MDPVFKKKQLYPSTTSDEAIIDNSKANDVGLGISLMSLKENRRMINKRPATVIIEI